MPKKDDKDVEKEIKKALKKEAIDKYPPSKTIPKPKFKDQKDDKK
jgi:hypothetical protein